eukprot:scaffold140583_cov21-Prasinocladus_malaysianus.AAC.1
MNTVYGRKRLRTSEGVLPATGWNKQKSNSARALSLTSWFFFSYSEQKRKNKMFKSWMDGRIDGWAHGCRFRCIGYSGEIVGEVSGYVRGVPRKQPGI